MLDRDRLARVAGFTLTELLVVVGIFAVLASLSMPSFRTAIARNQLSAASDRMRTAALLARSSAISLNSPVTFCAGLVSDGCHGDWTRSEWLVFEDRDRDGMVDTGEPTQLVNQGAMVETIALSGNGPFDNRVVFTPVGSAVTATGAFAAGRMRVCTNIGGNGEAIDLVLIGSGRLESERRTLQGGCVAL